MSVPDAERRVRINDSQAAAILALVLTLTGVISAILTQVLL
jgi:hypothetical protein